jgi:CheY-like chemotaxis protein
MVRFLLLDDEDIFNFLSEEVIHQVNPDYQCEVFSESEIALNYISSQIQQNLPVPDVILIDIRMPGMNGFDFLESIQQYSESSLKNTVVYILSSSLDLRDHNRAGNFSMVKGFESKPLSEEMVRDIISNLPAKKR